MPEDLDYQPLEPDVGTGDPAALGQSADLARLRDVRVELAVEIGRAEMTVGETLSLRPGSIVKLDRLAEEPMDLLVNGTRIARGEVVVIDEEFGLRLTEVIASADGTITSAALSQPGESSIAQSEPPAEPVDAEVVEEAAAA